MPEFIVGAYVPICWQDAVMACNAGHRFAAGCTRFAHHLVTFSEHGLTHQLLVTASTTITFSMIKLVIFLDLRLTDRYRLITHYTFIGKQFIIAVDAVEVLVLLNICFPVELFVALPTTEMLLVPCLAFCLCEGVVKDQL